MEHMTPLALLEPENSLGAKHAFRQLVVEEVLERSQVERSCTRKGQRSESFNGQMVGRAMVMVVMTVVVVVVMPVSMIVMVSMVMVMAAMSVVVIAVAVIEARILGWTDHPVGLEQAHTQKQGERHLTFH